MVSFAARSTSRTMSSTGSRSTPGIDGTGARRPSATNIGQIRSLVVSTVSRTMRRAHSVRRLRGGRLVRPRAGVASLRSLVSTGTTRTRGSIGRPYLMAMSHSKICDVLSCPPVARQRRSGAMVGADTAPGGSSHGAPRVDLLPRADPGDLAGIARSSRDAARRQVDAVVVFIHAAGSRHACPHFPEAWPDHRVVGLWRWAAADPGDGR